MLFNNIFPEKSFTIEDYYLVKIYLDLTEKSRTLVAYFNVCRDQKLEYACAVNLVLTQEIDLAQFGQTDPRIARILEKVGHTDLEVKGFNPAGAFPYELPAKVFTWAFIFKQRTLTSLLSTLKPFAHMLNPIFLPISCASFTNVPFGVALLNRTNPTAPRFGIVILVRKIPDELPGAIDSILAQAICGRHFNTSGVGDGAIMVVSMTAPQNPRGA